MGYKTFVIALYCSPIVPLLFLGIALLCHKNSKGCANMHEVLGLLVGCIFPRFKISELPVNCTLVSQGVNLRKIKQRTIRRLPIVK